MASINITKQYMSKQQGALNLAAFAVALPILMLIVAASVDIIRLPIVKQQLVGTLNASYDSLGYQSTIDSGDFQPAAGYTACMLALGNHNVNGCTRCDLEDVASCPERANSKYGLVAVQRALTHIVKELTDQHTNIFRRPEEHMWASVSVFNLQLDKDGTVNSIQQVASASLDLRNSFISSFDSSKAMEEFVTQNTKQLHGVWFNTSDRQTNHYFPISIVVMHVATRVKNYFGITKTIAEHLKGPDKDTNPKGHLVIKATLIRPLKRNIALMP